MELRNVSRAMISDAVTYERAVMHAAIYDVSQIYGRVNARGADAIDLLHRMSTNDLKPLENASGRSALTVLTNEKARFIDVLKVVRDPGGHTILLTSGGREQAVIEWLNKYVIMEDASFEAATDRIHQFLICGPATRGILEQYSSQPPSDDRNAVYDLRIGELPATMVKAPSFAGEGWFVLTASETSDEIRNRLTADVLAFEGAVLTPEAFEALRVENGTPIAPYEINEKHNPLETGLATEAVSFTKGCYIGQEVIARLDAQSKVQRHLMRIEIGLPAADAQSELMNASLPLKLLAAEGVEAGEVTSLAVAPSTGKVIGLGYVRSAFAKDGAAAAVSVNESIVLTATLRSI